MTKWILTHYFVKPKYDLTPRSDGSYGVEKIGTFFVREDLVFDMRNGEVPVP